MAAYFSWPSVPVFSLDFFHPHDQTFSIFCNFSVSLCALFLQSNVLVLILQDMWNNRLLLLGFLPPLFKGLLTTYADIIFLREMGQGFLWMLLTLWGLNQQDTVVSISYLFIYYNNTITKLTTLTPTPTMPPRTDLCFLSPALLGLQECPVLNSLHTLAWVRMPRFMGKPCLFIPTVVFAT